MIGIGDSVECIDANFSVRERYWVRSLPVLGGVYTVRGTAVGFRGLGLWLLEIINSAIPVRQKDTGAIFYIEPLFLVSRFRLLSRGGAVRSARKAHNLEVAGSNPAPATTIEANNREQFRRENASAAAAGDASLAQVASKPGQRVGRDACPGDLSDGG